MVGVSQDWNPHVAASPRITVIIPTFNCARFLRQAIDSILAQTLRPAEVIVVDDGSTDDTPDVLARYGNTVRSYRQANAGVSAARNRGLELAEGNVIAFLDADDVAASNRLELQWRQLSAVPDAVACFCGYWTMDEQAEHPRNVRCETGWPNRVHRGSLTFLEAVHALTYDIPLPMTVMFRKPEGDYARFPGGVKIGEDVLFCAMLRTFGSFTYVPAPLYGYRQRSGSASQTLDQVESFKQRLTWLLAARQRYCPEYSEEEIVASTWNALAEVTRTCYWARRREHFVPLRNFLRANWPAHLPRPDVVRWRWYPDWFWKAKERLDGYRRPAAAGVVEHAQTP